MSPVFCLFSSRLSPPMPTISLHFAHSIEMSQPVEEVTCNSHQIAFAKETDSSGLITVTMDPDKPRTDLVLDIVLDSAGYGLSPFILLHSYLSRPFVSLCESDEMTEKAAVVALQIPASAFGETSLEVIFLVDRSTSMDDGRLNSCLYVLSFAELSVKSIFPSILDQLPASTYFNVAGFGASMKRVFMSSQLKSAESIQTALEAIRLFDGDLGQTFVHEALEEVLAEPPYEAGRLRHIIIMTDGEIEDVPASVKIVSAHAHSTRTSVFVYGHPRFQYFARAVSAAGNGRFAVASEEMFVLLRFSLFLIE